MDSALRSQPAESIEHRPRSHHHQEGTAASGHGDDVGPTCTTMMMLHCLFAMVFAAGTLGVLNCLGFVVRSGTCCPAGEGYSPCEMWQDFRSILSFVLGALLCCILTHERQNGDGCGRVQLYTCLL
mmetsp:Transcript_57765/g.134550  ORF Transcript_57765/g.134550 Transcript_57765/m.134550 type:complete len:126 (-) Transcript_57765:133-510(-)